VHFILGREARRVLKASTVERGGGERGGSSVVGQKFQPRRPQLREGPSVDPADAKMLPPQEPSQAPYKSF